MRNQGKTTTEETCIKLCSPPHLSWRFFFYIVLDLSLKLEAAFFSLLLLLIFLLRSSISPLTMQPSEPPVCPPASACPPVCPKGISSPSQDNSAGFCFLIVIFSLFLLRFSSFLVLSCFLSIFPSFVHLKKKMAEESFTEFFYMLGGFS